MTTREAKKTVTQAFRKGGFKSYGPILARHPQAQAIQVAYVSLHRFTPQVLLDVGVLLRERVGEDPLGGRVRYTPLGWDLWTRFDTFLRAMDSGGKCNLLRLNAAFDLTIPMDGIDRIKVMNEAPGVADALFFKQFDTKESIQRAISSPGPEVQVNDRLRDYFEISSDH